MRKLFFFMLVALFVISFFAQTVFGDEMSDFRNNVKKLIKELQIARVVYQKDNSRFNEIRDPLLKMGKEHPDYSRLVKEHNELYEKMPALIQAVSNARQALQNEIINSLANNNKDVVEAVQKTLFKSSKRPDVSAELATVVGLQRITDRDAINFMIEELKTSRTDSWRKVLCQALAVKRDDAVTASLVETLKDRDWEIVVTAAEALSKNRSKSGVEPMISSYERACDKNDEGAMRGLRAALRKMTGEYMLDTARDFRNWWEGKGKDEYSENATARPKGIIGKDGPRSTLYGEITSKSVIFICDVSHSMSASGTVPANPTDGSDSGEKRPETGGEFRPDGKKKGEKSGLGKQGVQPGFTGTRIDILKIELEHVVMNMLPEDAKFNLIAYSATLSPWKKSLTKASDKYKKSALNFVKSMEPIGRTNTHDALALAFTDKSVDTIYFLSDGAPTTGKMVHPEEILTAVQRWNQGRKVIIHTIGLLVGKYQNEENHDTFKMFLKRLAEQNGGKCRIFENAK